MSFKIYTENITITQFATGQGRRRSCDHGNSLTVTSYHISLPIYTKPISATLYINLFYFILLIYFITFLGNRTKFHDLSFCNLHTLFYILT